MQPSVLACTVMRCKLGEQVVIARNHDWGTGGGLLIVNPRGIAKTAITPVNPHQWVSRYGSVSFAQFGREIPFAGMNEKGLTVDLLQLREAAFPTATMDKPTVNVVQWVQYQLDMSESVAEVIASLEEVDPVPFIAMLEKVHYFVSDPTGDVAVIEFLDGKPHIQREDVRVCALANSTWQDSCRAVSEKRADNVSEMRFMRASYLSSNAEKQTATIDPIDYAFAALERVTQTHTQWSLVYRPTARQIVFNTRTAKQRRWIDLDDLNFNEGAEVLCVDLNADLSGDLRETLEPFSQEANRLIVDGAFDAILPAGFVRMTIKEMVLNYGDSLAPSLVK
jgi:penicillin V acylase-like amidase (Ntn superfamily)